MHTKFGLEYLRFGNGSRLLVAIPGYGDRATIFEPLEKSLGESFTVYVLQLPLHGKSGWSSPRFYRSDFAKAIRQIMSMEQQQKVSLMGYSFGARVLCCLLEEFADQTEQLFLLAPDGFNQGYIRRATLLPLLVRKWLQKMLSNPTFYLNTVGWLHRAGLLKTYSYQFAKRNLANEQRRRRLFLFWNSIGDFRYDEARLTYLLVQNQINVKLILGTEDRVIPTNRWRQWGEALEVVEVRMVAGGHRVVGGGLDDLLADMLN